MAKLHVTQKFDYRFPSGSLVAFKPASEPVTTKREIVDYAVRKGFGKEVEVKPVAKDDDK